MIILKTQPTPLKNMETCHVCVGGEAITLLVYMVVGSRFITQMGENYLKSSWFNMTETFTKLICRDNQTPTVQRALELISN